MTIFKKFWGIITCLGIIVSLFPIILEDSKIQCNNPIPTKLEIGKDYTCNSVYGTFDPLHVASGAMF